MKAQTTSSTRRPRAAVLAAVAVSGSMLLSACQVISPRQTDVMYEPSDGVAVDLGPVKVRNLLVIADAADGPGVISAAVGNPSDTDAVISFVQGGEAPVQTTVPARGTANLSVDGPKVSIAKVPAAPGAVVTLVVSTPAAGQSPVTVPVLPATGVYADLKPAS